MFVVGFVGLSVSQSVTTILDLARSVSNWSLELITIVLDILIELETVLGCSKSYYWRWAKSTLGVSILQTR